MATRIFVFSIVLGAEYSFYVKTIATYAPTFFGYNNSILAIVNLYRITAKSCGTLDNLQLLLTILRTVLDMNLKMKVLLVISILIPLFAINSGHIILPGLLGIGSSYGNRYGYRQPWGRFRRDIEIKDISSITKTN